MQNVSGNLHNPQCNNFNHCIKSVCQPEFAGAGSFFSPVPLLYQLTTRLTMKNEQRYGKEAYCTYSLLLHCPGLNEIPAVCLIFINNLHVPFLPIVHWKRVKPFLYQLVLCAIYPSRNRTTLFILWYVI